MARPTKYNEEIADKICEKLSSSSKGLNAICKEINIAPSSVYLWLRDYSEFSEKYTRAREEQADFMVDQIIAIADDSSQDTIITDKGEMPNMEWINRSKLRVEARKWIASKLKPKKYGDKIDVTTGGEKMKGFVIELTNEANSKAE
jgi:hypothetical protein